MTDVHVWRLDLSGDSYIVSHLRSTLAADEQEQSKNFKFEVDRNRFVVRRALRRHILASYAHTTTDAIAFVYGAFGKPYARVRGGAGPKFSMSHSGRFALCAISMSADIGVDLEQLRDVAERDEIVRNMLSAREFSHYRMVPQECQATEFLRLWTAKEACVKAIGSGLHVPLPGIDTMQPARDGGISLAPWAMGLWSLRDLSQEMSGFAAAICARGQITSHQLFPPADHDCFASAEACLTDVLRRQVWGPALESHRY